MDAQSLAAARHVRPGISADGERRRISGLFRDRVEAGELRPLLLPQCLVASFVLPILYLSVPHARVPWLRRARFLVVAVVALLNAEMAANTSSDNVAVGYATGLLAAWSTIWVFSCLICSRPQLDAERVEKRRRPSPTSPKRQRSCSTGTAPSPSSPPASPLRTLHPSAMASGATGHAGCNGTSVGPGGGANGSHATRTAVRQRRRKSVRFLVPPDEDVAKTLVEHKYYYWQTFPADAPFVARLDWVLDYYTAWRGSGWNSAVTIPRFAGPEKPLAGELVKIESIPQASVAGCRRHTTYRGFLASRLRRIAVGYLVLDFCAVYMTSGRDPYFIVGPYPTAEQLRLLGRLRASLTDDTASTFAPHQPTLTPVLTYLARCSLVYAGLIAAFEMLISINQLWRHFAASSLLPSALGGGVRGELWHYPTTFGSFNQVLDRGLAGFWGRHWHQTFRLGFTAPAALLARCGLVPSLRHSVAGKVVSSLCAFFLSGALHAVGSYTALRPTRPWKPWLFFVLNWLGIVLQAGIAHLLRDRIAACAPRWLRRVTNLLFVCLWLLATSWLIIDDFTASGLWLLEVVPFSPLRALGFGLPRDPSWRWSGGFGRWHVGRHWWECGYGI